ncbi:MAG: hypothetical protein M1840_003362 [Geoglossum simile]|nr:MAG: hypothetical protein M1840_003362 [Geoglossum simile]
MPGGRNPKDIYIVGAQCTGKTTLVKALEEYFKRSEEHDGYRIDNPKIITEVARDVLKQYKFTAEDIRSSPARALSLQQRILEAQLNAERAASDHGEWFISDRSGADPIVYAQKYVSGDAAEGLVGSAEWLELRERLKKSVVIVCEAGADWLTDDGVRLMPVSREEWVGFHRLFCNCLDDWGLRYEVLPCGVTNLNERIEFVLGRWGLASKSGKEPEILMGRGRGGKRL